MYIFVAPGQTEASLRASLRKTCREHRIPPWKTIGPWDTRDITWWWLTQSWRRK